MDETYDLYIKPRPLYQQIIIEIEQVNTTAYRYGYGGRISNYREYREVETYGLLGLLTTL